eukprot:m.402200 g.402200  ORF g.402200 m.402200 type:complete len:108 (-) comp28406_c1_seq11:3179-3502(-)
MPRRIHVVTSSAIAEVENEAPFVNHFSGQPLAALLGGDSNWNRPTPAAPRAPGAPVWNRPLGIARADMCCAPPCHTAATITIGSFLMHEQPALRSTGGYFVCSSAAK